MNVIKSIVKKEYYIEVTIIDGTVLQFSAYYSTIEDCVNLVLLTGGINGNHSMTVMKGVFVGATDEAYKFLETIKEK